MIEVTVDGQTVTRVTTTIIDQPTLTPDEIEAYYRRVDASKAFVTRPNLPILAAFDDPMSDLDRRIVELTLEGKADKEIAQDPGVLRAPGTVRNRRNLLRKQYPGLIPPGRRGRPSH